MGCVSASAQTRMRIPELVAVAVAVAVLVPDDVAVEELVAVAVAVDDSVYNHNLNHTSQAAVTGLLSTSVLTSCDCKHLPELVAVAELELVDVPAHTRISSPPPKNHARSYVTTAHCTWPSDA